MNAKIPLSEALDAEIDRLMPSALSVLERMIAVNSITPNFYTIERASVIGGETDCSRLLAGWLAEAGFDIHEVAPDPERVNTVSVRRGAGGGRSLLLNGHVDTVAPFRPEAWKAGSPWTPLHEDGRLYGLGACDMKGGLVACALAARALAEAGVRLKGDLQIHAVVGEETGSYVEGVTAPLKAGFIADAAIIAEPSSGRDILPVAPVSYGLQGMMIVVRGLGTHVGNRALAIRPGGLGNAAGVNAVEKAILVVNALLQLEQQWGISKQHPAFPPGAFTLTPSVFHGDVGYPSAGYFADKAEVRYVVWYPPNEPVEAIRAEIEAQVHHAAQQDSWLRDNPPEVRWTRHLPPADTPADHPLVTTLQACRMDVLGDRAASPAIRAFEASSDAPFIEAAGIPCTVFGPGSLRRAHAMDEYLELDELRDAARILARMIVEWCGTE